MHRYGSLPAPISCTGECFACSPLPTPRLQISHTILTQVGWCAVRAAARCEQGLLPVITTAESGSRVFGTDRSVGRSAWLAIQRSNKCACAVVGPSSGCLPQSPAADSLKPDEIPGPNHAMERKEVFDGRRIMLLGPESRSAVRLDLGSLEALIPRDEECSEQDKPKPRFLLQEIIFAHSPYEGFFHNWPCLHGIFCTDQIGFADEEFRRQNA